MLFSNIQMIDQFRNKIKKMIKYVISIMQRGKGEG